MKNVLKKDLLLYLWVSSSELENSVGGGIEVAQKHPARNWWLRLPGSCGPSYFLFIQAQLGEKSHFYVETVRLHYFHLPAACILLFKGATSLPTVMSVLRTHAWLYHALEFLKEMYLWIATGKIMVANYR